MTRTTSDWEALLDGATPGPWHVGGESADGNIYVGNYDPDIGGPAATTGLDDAPLVAAAPEAVAEVVRLRREVEYLTDHVARLENDLIYMMRQRNIALDELHGRKAATE